MTVGPYLNFDGRCEEALNFYRDGLGATVSMMMRYKDSPEPLDPNMVAPGTEHKIMHASFRIGSSDVMAADSPCRGQSGFAGFSLAVAVANAAEADRVFAALAAGGKATMPLTRTFFSPSFGMVTDKFGVQWTIMAEPPASPR